MHEPRKSAHMTDGGIVTVICSNEEYPLRANGKRRMTTHSNL